MSESTEGPRRSLWQTLVGAAICLGGIVGAGVLARLPLRALSESNFNAMQLPPDWLSGYVLLIVAGILVSLSGWSILKGKWAWAVGRLLVAGGAGYAGARLVLIVSNHIL